MARRLSTGAIVGIVAGGITLVLAVAAIAVAVIVFSSDIVRLRATGVSMEPTIRAGQTVSATKVHPGEYTPKRGDIVAFTAPGEWLAANSDQTLIKRVIGLPGERVACCDPQGRWMIGGTPFNEPYVKAGGASPGTSFDIIVPEGRLWVMGDNRSASNDSRTLFASTRDADAATIPVSAVLAVVKP